MRVGVNRIAVRSATPQAAGLEVAGSFVESCSVMQVVRAVHPAEEVRVRGIPEVERRGRADAELQRKTEVSAGGSRDIRRSQKSVSNQVLADNGVVARSLISDPPAIWRRGRIAGKGLHCPID